LLAIDRVGDQRRVDAGADIEAPDLLQCLCVIGRDRAVVVAEEHEVAGGRERARIVRIGEPQIGFGFAGGRIDGLEAAIAAFGVLGAAAGKALARLDGATLVGEILLFDRLDDVAAFDRRDVEQAELGIVGGGFPVLAAAVGRTGTPRRACRGCRGCRSECPSSDRS